MERNKLNDEELSINNELINFFDVIPDMVVIASVDGYFKKLNKMWETVLGYTIDELKEKQFIEFIHPDDIESTLAEVNNQLNNKATANFVNRYRCKDGSYKWLDWMAMPSPDGSNLFAVARDITEKKKTQEELLKSEARFKQVARSSGIWVWEVDQNGLYTYISESEESILGYKVEDLIGKKYFYDFFAPEVKEELKNAAMEVFAKKLPFNDFQNPNIHKDGHTVILETSGIPLLDKDGNLTGYLGADKDVSERIKIERTLSESEEIFRKAFLTNPDAITLNRFEDGKYVSVNNGFSQTFKYLPEDVIGKSSLEIKIWESPEERNRFAIKLNDSGFIENFETRLYDKYGKIHDCLISATIIEFEGVPHLLSTTKDITELKIAREEIESGATKLKAALDIIITSEKEFRLLAESMPQIVWITRADGWNTYFNQQWVDYTGLSLEESYGNGWNIPFHPDDKQYAWESWQNAVSTNGIYSLECRLRRKDGVYRWWLIRGVPILDDNNKIIKWFGTCTDIHQIKQAEDQLIAAKEKAEENDRLKSALLANMSHEIRTPMNAIMGFANLINEADEAERPSFASIIEESSSHLLKLIDDVILLSRLQSEKMPVTRNEFRPSELVDYAYRMFQHDDLNKGLQIKKYIPAHYKDLVVFSDESKIRQVLLSLVSNAIKYTFKGSVEIGFNLQDNQLEFYVQDTGMGISADEQNKIFETFYRSERATFFAIRGNGLGLSIAKELILSVGGAIAVESKLEVGSRFYFSVPFENPKHQPNKPATSVKTKKDLSHAVILVAEDEPLNYKLLEIFLKNKVGKIEHAINGKVAIDLISRNKYDLVLMDIKMPVMGGIEATKILKINHPDLPVIAQTAFTLSEEKQNALDAGCDDFIPKPIDKLLLLEKISKYL